MKSREKDRREYIGAMAFELAKMARADGHDVLSYLLEVAAVEAEASDGQIAKFQPASKGHHEVQRL